MSTALVVVVGTTALLVAFLVGRTFPKDSPFTSDPDVQRTIAGTLVVLFLGFGALVLGVADYSLSRERLTLDHPDLVLPGVFVGLVLLVLGSVLLGAAGLVIALWMRAPRVE